MLQETAQKLMKSVKTCALNAVKRNQSSSLFELKQHRGV